jgi:hypothetical protein
MKSKFIFKLLIHALIVLVLSLAFAILGYKSFCTLDQVIDWNAVSAITGILVMVLTFAALLIAILVPQEDRIRQSKLDLFAERFEVYYAIDQALNGMFTGENIEMDLKESQKTFRKLSFLIEKEDFRKIKAIFSDVQHKKELVQTGNLKEESANIDDETLRMYAIFEKYLAIKDHEPINQ